MAIFLVGLLVVGAASAADVDVNDTGKLSAGENDEIVSVENDVDVLGEGEYNYTQLKDQFRFDGDITLFAGNYTYVSGDGDTIEITTSRVIDGNGAVIDMANSGHGAFSVTTSGVTIKNLTIKNANFEGNGGAIYFMYSGIVINCNFTNNTATVYGGAVYFQDEGNVTNCNFTDNNARIYGGAVYFQKGGNVTNCNFTDNTASGTGGAVYFQNEGNVTNCNFIDNNARIYGGAVYFQKGGNVTNCNFTDNTASGTGGAVYFQNEGNVTNCNFTGNNATWYGGAVYFQKAGNVTNCNFTGNNATTGSAIYFWSASATKTVSNSRFLNNIANAETLEVTKNDNNITITFTGNDNLLNAIYSNSDVTFTNVTYWGSKGIVNTGSSAIKPSRSNKEAGQNITLEIYDSDSLVDNVTLVTDDNGQVSYDLSKLSNGKYRYKAYHPEDSYYTYAESNDTFTKGVGDFNLLQRYINAADSVLTLDRNYTFTTGLDENLTDGIIIDKPLTINGNGFTINADGKARIFQIKSNDVVLKDITFKNGYTNGDGGAIHWSTNNSNILNCYFINNTAKRGGANHFENELQDSNINATFINNTANGLYLFYGGGANYFKDALNNITISGDYSNNKAVNYGGANYFNSKISTLTIAGDYAGNAANGDGGANYFNSLFNVTITGDYTSNTARNDGGANCFLSALTDVNITGDYTNNKAGLGGANNFEKELTNVAISGKYVKNTATGFAAGANIFKDQLTNVTITGDYISNTAMSFNAFGGANSFVKELANVTITGNYTNNSADYLGGANCFLSELTDVNITGDYTGNRVNSSGGANYFEKVLTNVTITGDYTSNIANYHTGGANYFLSELTNVAITGDYSNNKAKDHGGANYFDKTLFNLTITGDYTSNTAGVDGGANYFKIELTEVNITGDYSNNTAGSDGGANHFNTLTNVTITGNYISNTAGNTAGANHFNTLTNVTITGNYISNTAGSDGGANHFGMLTNVTITGDYISNTAGSDGGANHFGMLTNVTITGDYISNGAGLSGGANYFFSELTNVVISGDYTNNTSINYFGRTSRDNNGGANFFRNNLTNVTITGDYIGNAADNSGGANYFSEEVTNVIIMGDYISNSATNGSGGANYFKANYYKDQLTNVVISGDYASNTAKDAGGANYIHSELTNVNITGDYCNNTAGSAGANYFENALNNVAIIGDYAINTANGTGGANYFHSELTNVSITGDYTNNKANEYGGANCFYSYLINVNITGDYTSNTANANGGANYFQEPLSNVAITGDYTSNTANANGGANCFYSYLINVNITGTFTNNKATNDDGGANSFLGPLTNVTITGDYTSNTAYWEGGANYFKNTLTNATITGNYTNNKATNGNGGANHFHYQITNVAIMGDYTNNTAINGGANYFTELTNVTITGNYTNNKATNGDGGANHFSDKQNNVTITGDYTSNTANANGGANCFYSYLINVTITGDYTSNTASNYNGGANYFHEELTNVAITGDYTSNTANANGGANCFYSYLINVNITGTFTNNKATNDDGGANSFLSPLTNVTITGDYTANKANGYGGANSFLNPLTNVTISGDYTGNTACDGGANYFSKITNVNITGEYTANKALGSGGAIYFAIETNYLNVRGVFINNSGFYIIFIDKSIENNVIRDSIFLNNNAKNINLDQGDIQLVNNWFGNNATNYNVTPDIGSVTPDNWLFLNATVDPVKFTSSTNVTFKLDSYDANTKNVTDYNNNLISPIELTLTSTNATVKNSTHLNETVKYVAGDGEKGSVTATFENAQYTIELQTDKKNPKLSVESETFNYNETMALALSYNPNATGNVSVTLNGKKHIYNYTGLALNVTVMLSGDILPDEYNVTVMYGGDVNFFGTSANSTLTVKKANSTLKVTDITFDYNGTGSCEVTYTNATGVTAEVIGHNEATINVTNNLITVSGLDAGNYSLSVTTITSEGYSNVTKTSKITVKPTLSLVSAENVNVTYGEDIIIPVKSVNATEVKYEIIECDKVVNNGTVMSGENITGLRLASGTYTVNLTTIVDSNHIQSSGQSLLTVKKAQSSIDVNGTESYYKNDAVLNYAVVNATGVNVDIVDWAGNPMKSGVDYNISISKSQIIIDFFNDGRYVANVTTITDNNHTSACMGAEIRVLPVIDLEISIAPENQTAHYGDTLSWKVIIVNHGPSMAENLYLDFFADDGIIFTDQYGKQYAKHYRFSDVYPIGVDYPFICILKTLANATDAELCFNVTVGDIYSIYPNLSKYNASASVKVEHASANISVNADSQIVVGESLTVTVELPSDATGNVTVTVDGEKYIGTINEGIATISIPDLAAGEKTAIISYPGDNRYSPINETRDITVSRKNTTADISAPTSITLGDDASVDVKLPGDAKGNVTVIVDGEILDTVPLSNGAVDVTLPEMKAGNHTVEVIYSGDEKYNPVSETKNITVLKQNATAEVSLPENVTYGDDESVDVILPGDATGNVTVKVDGDDVGSVEVVNGSASVALPTLSAGDHAVEVVYSGDDKYAPVSQTVNVAVVKSTPKLTSNKKTFKNTDKYKKYTVSLKDSKGNAIVNATVTLKVNGKTYTAKTNSNGKATFKLTKLTKKGTYTAVIKFAGDEKYNNASAKAKINVKSTWKTISKGSSYHTMVKKIQRALKNHGFYIKYNKRHLIVDGIFHIYTEMAVKQFQKANGLKQTGRVDEITAKELGLI